MTRSKTKTPWRRWSYGVAVLTAAAMIAAPALVSAQSASHGEDQMFTSLPLCKIIDSRNWTAADFGGDTKPQADTTYTFDIRGESQDFSGQGGSASGCGVPTTADVVLINLLAVSPDGGGNMKAFPEDQAHTDVSGTVINYNSLSPNVNLNNAVAVLMDASTDDGDINIRPQINGTHIIGTVLGYFENTTDGFYTEAQSDARFASDFHDHEVAQDIGDIALAGSTDDQEVASVTINLDDECFFGDRHKLMIAASGYTSDGSNYNIDLELEVDGDVRQSSAQQLDNGSGSLIDDSFAIRELITQIDSDGDGTDDQFIGSGSHTIRLIADNNDAGSTSLLNVVLTVERMGWDCGFIIIPGADAESTDSADAGPGDSEETSGKTYEEETDNN